MSETPEQYRARVMAAVGPKSTERPEFQQNAGGGYADEEGADVDDIEQKARQEWNSNPAVRAEFIEIENLIAFRVAEAAGLARVCGGGVVK